MQELRTLREQLNQLRETRYFGGDSGKVATAEIPADQDSDNDGLTDIEEAGPQTIAPAGLSQTEDYPMLQLWQQWNYELNNLHRWW